MLEQSIGCNVAVLEVGCISGRNSGSGSECDVAQVMPQA